MGMGTVRTVAWALVLAACLPALAGDIADSTGTVRATRALVLPQSITLEQVKQTIVDNSSEWTTISQGIPAGYVSYTINAGPHAGATPSYPNVTYGYVRMFAGSCADEGCSRASLDANLCEGNLSHRVIELVNDTTSNHLGGLVWGHYTCEPIGKVTGLIKADMASITTITQAQVNTFALPGTLGVNISGVAPICQALGFTNYVPGSVAYWYTGSGCPGGMVTQYRSGSWVADTACYNNVLTNMQCYL